MIHVLFQFSIPFGSNTDNNGITCLDLLDVGKGFLVNVPLGCQCDDRNTFYDQSKCTMLQLTRSIGLCVDVRNLLELECSLEGYGIVKTAADVENILIEPVLLGKCLDGINVRQDL